MEFEPLVSVVLPSFNRERCIGRAARSVLAQSYQKLELIIVDDGSTDNTAEVMKEIADNRVSYVRHDNNRGAAAARNTGILHARGELLAFQDSDDEWLLDKLTRQVEALSLAGDSIGAVFGGKILYGKDASGRYGDRLTSHIPLENQTDLSGRITKPLMARNFISPQTLLMRRYIAVELGGFDERLPCNEDWDFMLRLSLVTKILCVSRPVVVAYISDDSLSLRRHSNVFSQLVVVRKFRSQFDANPRIYARHLFRLGFNLSRMGKSKSGKLLVVKALAIDPWSLRHWIGFLAVLFETLRRSVAVFGIRG